MDESVLWQAFTRLLSENKITAEKLRPYHKAMTEPLLTFLDHLRERMLRGEKAEYVKSVRVGDMIHCFISLDDGQYCFSFVLKDDDWFFVHIESILLRLDEVTAPTASFPDISEQRKNWIRQEREISNNVRMFNLLKHEKGSEYALDWFLDGDGYFLMARSWVPYVEPQRAFVLFLCWEQANLTGNAASLERFENNRAVIKIKPMYMEMYKKTGHIRQQISYEDYIGMFEAIWRDRAEKAGWTLRINYEKEECVFDLAPPGEPK
ncbi:MAG: hypothetical protein GX111_11590 [Clostridiales bacterium]|jgi:hypothetical protein|nr:hypothetical protein [Clostridiales bacterium]